MSVPSYPKTNPRKVYRAPTTTWDLNSGALYSFKVVLADPESGSIDITRDFSGFTEFVLPINPQGIQVSIPFAMNTTATSGGVLEEASGVVFRQIMISGTFGVAARKAVAGIDTVSVEDLRQEAPQNNPLKGVSGGALTLAAGLVNTIGAVAAAQRAAQNVSNKPPALQSGIKLSDLSELGHAKVNDLLNYFVAYAELKKTVEGKNARLVFVNRKDGVNYAVTPQTFDTSKDANDPHITRYRVSMKAWDIASGVGLRAVTSKGLPGSPEINELTKALNELNNARSVVAALKDVVRGATADFDNLISTINSIGILLKDLTSTALSFADLGDLAASKGNELVATLDALGADLGARNEPDVTNPLGLPVAGGSNKLNFANQQVRDASNPLRTLDQRLSLLGFLDQILPSAIALSPAEQAAVDEVLNEAKQATISDLDAKRAIIEAARDALADSIGLNDADTDLAFDRVPGPQLRDPQPADFQAMKALADVIAAIDTLTATRDVVGTRVADPFIRARANTNNPEVEVRSSTSGFPIPFPLNATLEGLAQQYLGNPDRWLEIALANGLQAPYIDEEGFEVEFSANGDGNTFYILDASKLFVGQEVFISSRTQASSRRFITGIRKLPSETWAIQVDGEDDLDSFLKAQRAKVKAFLAGTVNSSKMIVIPTPGVEPGDAVPNSRQIPITANLDRQQRSMGVDLYLTPDFDLALDGNGDFKLVAGTANAIQAVKLKLSTPKRGLPRHPEVGLGFQIGSRSRSPDGVRASIENAILGDDRFTAVQDLVVNFDGPVITLSMRVRVAGGSDIIPLSFTLQ